MSKMDDLIELRKLFDYGKINKKEFLLKKEKIVGIKPAYENIFSDTGNLIPSYYKEIDSKNKWKKIRDHSDFIYYQKISRFKLDEDKITYIFEYDEKQISEDNIPSKYYKKFQNKPTKNVKYKNGIYSGEIYLDLHQISEITLYPDSKTIYSQRERDSHKIKTAGSIEIVTPQSVFDQALDLFLGSPLLGIGFGDRDSAISGFRDIYFNFDYVNNDYYDKLVDFRRDVIKSIRNQVTFCPECGQTKFIMKQHCDSCQWRYKYIRKSGF